MSAFVVSFATLDRFLSRLAQNALANDGTAMTWQLKRRAPDGGPFDVGFEEGRANLQALGQRMLDLNYRAVQARYPDVTTGGDWPGTIDEAGTPYRFTYHHVTDASAVKALDCWLYQCSEGDCPSDPLYQQMEELANRMAAELGRETDGYKKAEWDS